jgi:hypothetical protein
MTSEEGRTAKRPVPSLDFLREPAPRVIPNHETWVYATRSHRYMLSVALGSCFALWLLFMAIGSLKERTAFVTTLQLSTIIAGSFAVLFGVPAWWYGQSKVREIRLLLENGELTPGTAQISSQRRRPRFMVRSNGSPPVVSFFSRFGRELAGLRSGDSVQVLLARDPAAGNLAALVTETELCVGWVYSSLARNAPRPLGLRLLVGGVFVLVAFFGLLCTLGTLFVIVQLFFLQERPFGHSLGFGLFSLVVMGSLAGFLLTVGWRLLGYVLGREEAPYLFHPAIGVGVGVVMGLLSTVGVAFTLVNGAGLGREAAAPFLFFGFAWLQARVLMKRRAKPRILEF